MVNNGAAVHVIFAQDKCPEFHVCSLKKVTGLSLEHGVIVGDSNELEIILTLAITNEGFEKLANAL